MKKILLMIVLVTIINPMSGYCGNTGLITNADRKKAFSEYKSAYHNFSELMELYKKMLADDGKVTDLEAKEFFNKMDQLQVEHSRMRAELKE